MTGKLIPLRLNELLDLAHISFQNQFANQLAAKHFSVFASFYSGSILNGRAADHLFGIDDQPGFFLCFHRGLPGRTEPLYILFDPPVLNLQVG